MGRELVEELFDILEGFFEFGFLALPVEDFVCAVDEVVGGDLFVGGEEAGVEIESYE